jgi:hypothetical protein
VRCAIQIHSSPKLGKIREPRRQYLTVSNENITVSHFKISMGRENVVKGVRIDKSIILVRSWAAVKPMTLGKKARERAIIAISKSVKANSENKSEFFIKNDIKIDNTR